LEEKSIRMSERIYFGKIKEAVEPPNLIEVQLNSYVEFLQKDVPPSKRKSVGLQAVFKEVFPIQSYDDKVVLDFASYDIGDPKMSALDCQREGQTFSAPLHVTFQLKDEKGTDAAQLEITGTKLSVSTFCNTAGKADSKIKEAPHL